MEKHTVSMHFVAAAVAQLNDAQRSQVLADANIPPQWLHSLDARVQASAFAAVWLAVAHTLNDEFFGYDSRRMKVGSFALLGHAALPAANLGSALRRILKGLGLFLDDLSGELVLEGERAAIRVQHRTPGAPGQRFADETFFILVHGLLCWLAGRRIPVDEVVFAHARPPYAQEYTAMFSEHARFGLDASALHLAKRWLALPVVQTEASLKVFLRNAPQSVFLKYRNESSLSARLRRRLRCHLGAVEWPGLEAVAREFHTTPTTLRRRLLAEGTSYQDIKDALRYEAAIDLLCHSTLSVEDIGLHLGFQEPSTFHRAFKKWSGLQPGKYRVQHAAQQAGEVARS
jgi:AraC-like DNA-binding protein